MPYSRSAHVLLAERNSIGQAKRLRHFGGAPGVAADETSQLLIGAFLPVVRCAVAGPQFGVAGHMYLTAVPARSSVAVIPPNERRGLAVGGV